MPLKVALPVQVTFAFVGSPSKVRLAIAGLPASVTAMFPVQWLSFEPMLTSSPSHGPERPSALFAIETLPRTVTWSLHAT